MSDPSTDVIRRVFDESGKNFVEVGPFPDDPGCVELRTVPGEGSDEWYGKLSLSMTPRLARELGRAMIDAASDCEKA
jgi:hypothetical protein